MRSGSLDLKELIQAPLRASYGRAVGHAASPADRSADPSGPRPAAALRSHRQRRQRPRGDDGAAAVRLPRQSEVRRGGTLSEALRARAAQPEPGLQAAKRSFKALSEPVSTGVSELKAVEEHHFGPGNMLRRMRRSTICRSDVRLCVRR